MSEKIIEPNELPWDKNIKSNTFGYKEVKNKTSKNESYIYRFTGKLETLLKGPGIQEMQVKLAYVFRMFWYESIYLPYYINDKEYQKALTSGIYGPKTMEMVMKFQKIYMENEFTGVWDISKGFGSFGGLTKRKLESIWKEIRRIETEKRRVE